MHRVAKRMVNDSEVVSDIVQDVFIYLYEKLNNGTEILYPKSWLYRVTSNKCIDFLRKQKRFQDINNLIISTTEDKSSELREMKAIVSNALNKLKPQEKALAVLYSEGLSYKEIAEATGIKFSSIGKKLSRTLKKLEHELKDQRYELY
jgi:RNA polymerase sigma-70 factor (ECF subfamily)